jgi:hypothetical protein
MGFALYRVEYHKVIDLTEDEVDAVIGQGQVLDDPTTEMFVTLDFDDDEQVDGFRNKVRPEVFQAIKALAEGGETFIVA